MFAYFQTLSFLQVELFMASIAFIIIIIFIGIVIIRKLFKSMKISKSGLELDSGNNFTMPIMSNLEVRDYRNLLIFALEKVKGHVKYMLKRDNWAEVKDWEKYKEDIIRISHAETIAYINMHYYPSSLVTREDIIESFKMVDAKVDSLSSNALDRILGTYQKFNAIIETKKAELQQLIDDPICNAKKSDSCSLLLKVYKLTSEIYYEESFRLIEIAMTETEKNTEEIMNIYLDNYCHLYRQKSEGGKK